MSKFSLSITGRRLSRNLILACLLLSGSTTAVAYSTAPSFVIGDVTYGGAHLGSVDAFLGVPFAQPPIGERRWQAPAEFKAQTNYIETSRFKPACAQSDRIVKWYQSLIEDFGGDGRMFPAPTFSEDCLYLNIWRPSSMARDFTEKAGTWPVYVYLHGGSNKAGWSYEPNYIGYELAQQGVVVISIAYRLGVFGYFSHPDLTTSNFALLDQLAGLTWIKQHVAKIGGDPENITVAGESAGADNIAVLLASPLTKNLLKKVVIQSGGWSINQMRERSSDLARTQKMTAELALEANTLEALKTVPADKLIDAAERSHSDFGPVVGDTVLPRSLRQVVVSGALPQVNAIIGSNANEYRMYLSESQTVERWFENEKKSVPERLEISNLLRDLAELQDKQSSEVLHDDAQKALYQADALWTALEFGCPSLQLARAIQAQKGTARMYYFSQAREGELGRQMGAYHGAELPYIFRTHDDWLPTSQKDWQLTDFVTERWLAFLRDEPQDREWPSLGVHDSVLMLKHEPHVEPHPSTHLCAALGLSD